MINLWGIDFTEDVVFATDKKVTLSGGYNGAYSARNGATILHGSLRVWD